MASDPGTELDAAFAATLAGELRIEGTTALPEAWPTPRVPAPLRSSCVDAARLAGGVLPDSLRKHYGEFSPREHVELLLRGRDSRTLLWRTLDLEVMPRLRTALDGLCTRFVALGLDPSKALGAATPADLLRARPHVAGLYAHTLFGSGVPFLGAHPAERVLLDADLAEGIDPLEVIDRRLSANLVHELAHGQPHAGPTPWFVLEASAAWLGAQANPEHFFPRERSVAVPGAAKFVLLGDALARCFGDRAIASLACGVPFVDAFGARVASVLTVAGWQDWLARLSPPLVFDPLHAVEWAKLADATRLPSPPDAVARAFEVDPSTGSPGDLPLLVKSAHTIPWSDLPWSHEPVTDVDHDLVLRAFDGLALVNELSPTFATNPSDPPDRELVLDVDACLLRAKRRPNGVFAEPATWLVPPNVCRLLAERGAECVRVTGVTHRNRRKVAAGLLEWLHQSSPLSRDTEFAWTSSRRR